MKNKVDCMYGYAVMKNCGNLTIVKIQEESKLNFFNVLIVIAAISECVILYLEPSLIPQAIATLFFAFIVTFLALKL